MKKVILECLAVALAIGLSGCGGNKSAAKSSSKSTSSSAMKPAKYAGKLDVDGKTYAAKYADKNTATVVIDLPAKSQVSFKTPDGDTVVETYDSKTAGKTEFQFEATTKAVTVIIKATTKSYYKTATITVSPDPQYAKLHAADVAKAAAEASSIKKAEAASAAASSSRAAAKSASISMSESASSVAAESSSKAAAAAAAQAEANKYNTGITFDQIARNPDQYTGKLLHMTGKVIQEMEDDGTVDLRVAINGDYDDVVLVELDDTILNGSRILEDDLVTFYGMSLGTQDYESTMGATITVPYVVADKVTDSGTASDDYGY